MYILYFDLSSLKHRGYYLGHISGEEISSNEFVKVQMRAVIETLGFLIAMSTFDWTWNFHEASTWAYDILCTFFQILLGKCPGKCFDGNLPLFVILITKHFPRSFLVKLSRGNYQLSLWWNLRNPGFGMLSFFFS